MPKSDSLQASDFDAIALKVASPEKIHEWSHGEVTKPETINYRTQRPEKGGLFAEEIFGPTKDYQCYCGKYKKIRYKGIVCDKCGTEVTHSSVRRKRMGHIDLEAPVTHIWFLRSIPSKIGIILDMSVKDIEKVVYFASFIITDIDYEEKEKVVAQIEQEFESKKQQLEQEADEKISELGDEADEQTLKQIRKERDSKVDSLKEDMEEAKEDLNDISMLNIVSENRYQELSIRFGHLFKAEIGGGAIRRLLKNLDLEKTIEELREEIKNRKGAKRKRMIRRMKLLSSLKKNDINPEWMVLTTIPIIPPDLRPMVSLDGGRFATSDINDLYRRVINRNNRLKRLHELNAPEVICRNEKRMLQEAVDSMIDNGSSSTKTVTSGSQNRELRSLSDIVKGKQGRFRQNLLGKRVDYSGRSVIVVGPTLDIDECGIPKEMALELYKPHVISEIIDQELAHNVKSASKLIEDRDSKVWDILEEVTEGTRVLLNRAPTLHRLGIQAFKPRLIEGKAVQLHPLVCPGFNADFDGDQMAVHLPITEEAKWEAENLMAAEKNVVKPSTGDPIMTPQQDISLGCYYLTKFYEDDTDDIELENYYSDPSEAKFAYKKDLIDLKKRIKVRFRNSEKFEEDRVIIETSVGRIIFNEILPKEVPFYNKKVTKTELSKIIEVILEHYSHKETARILDKMKELGFDYVTESGYSLCTRDFGQIEQRKEIIQEGEERVDEVEQQYMEGLLTDSERRAKVIEIWTDIKDEVLSYNKDAIDKDGPVFAMIDSKSRGSWGQLGQVIGMKGLVASPSGEVIELPVKGNFKEGFDVLEFFISSHGTRKGLSDTALRTASAGYLTRRLVDVSQDVIVTKEDCGDTEGEVITIEDSEYMGEELSERVKGRFVLDDVKDGGEVIVEEGEVIDEKAAKQIKERNLDNIHVRSVLTCNLPKNVCVKCYGNDLTRNDVVEKGFPAGIVAAQSIGEPGTQLTMRTFHHGGAASGDDITQGLPRVEELFEARNPKAEATLSEVSGKVEIEDADGKIITSSSGRKKFEGRKGQKIIKVHFKEMEEESIRLRKSDDMKVEEGDKVKEGDVMFIHGTSGEKIEAEYDGEVRFEDKKLILKYRGNNTKEYVTSVGSKLLVEDGEEVEKGQQLTAGHVDPNKLYKLKGREAVQRMLLKEVQEVYAGQGQRLNDKHIEIVVKKMFSRMKVVDPGETSLLPGETVERAEVVNANQEIKNEEEQAKANEQFMGISKVSLSTQSFLSAASFQETSKVLIDAAITGKVDNLTGLKENVIIGRLVPVGTGFKEDEYSLYGEEVAEQD